MSKFEEAAIRRRDGTFYCLGIESILDIERDNFLRYNREIENQMYCPECLTPHLVLVHKQGSPHLRTLQGEQHKDCSKTVPPLTKRVTDCLEDHINPLELHAENLLRDAIKLLLCGERTKYNPFIVSMITKDRKTMVKRADEEVAPQGCYSLPRKRITEPLYKEDFDTCKVFYGDVDVEFKSLDNGDCILRVRRLGNEPAWRRECCSIYIKSNILNYIPATYLEKSSYRAHFAAILRLYLDKKCGKYVNACLWHSSCLSLFPF